MKILLIEAVNFKDFPAGGQLNFAKQLTKVFGNKIAIVGISTTDEEPIGRWFKKELDGVEYKYFSIGRRKIETGLPLVPDRVKNYLQLKKYKKKIMSLGIKNVFIQGHEILIAIRNWEFKSVCYRFPGVENPLSISRYSWAKSFTKVFDWAFFKSLKSAEILLAAADTEAIVNMIEKRGTNISHRKIISLPTRVDESVFYPHSKTQCRKKLKLPKRGLILSTCGRLHWAKGWELLLDSFLDIVEKRNDSLLIFIGDGEDRGKVLQKASSYGISNNVHITGPQEPGVVSSYLNASDLFVMGSYAEGWSTALVEATACGLPIVTTNFSSANSLVKNNENGYVVQSRDSQAFSRKIWEALEINNAFKQSVIIAKSFSIQSLKGDIQRHWLDKL